MESRPSVFVDANVFLDVLWKNKGWESSLEVIEKVRRGEIKGFVSVLTIAIIYFFHSQEFTKRKARTELVKSIKMFEISTTHLHMQKLLWKIRGSWT